jgi:hypothetical protein
MVLSLINQIVSPMENYFPDKCQLIDQRLKELGSAEKKADS